MNFYIAVREILRISDEINLSLIYCFLGQKIVKVSPPFPPLEAGVPVVFSLKEKQFLFCIAVRYVLRIKV